MRKRGDEIIDLRASLNTTKEEYKLLEGQILAPQNEKEAVAFEQDAYNAKVGRVQASIRICEITLQIVFMTKGYA